MAKPTTKAYWTVVVSDSELHSCDRLSGTGDTPAEAEGDLREKLLRMAGDMTQQQQALGRVREALSASSL